MTNLDQVRRRDAAFGLFSGLDASSIERELAAKTADGPLEGRLVGLKANVACAGAVWSAGLEHRKDLRAQEDAFVTRCLRAAAARVLPGLNMDAAALGGTTENPYFGSSRNPRSADHSAGGSSGGSAAAMSLGLVDLAIGTDTLGSIRIPASWCGVFGLKPTFGAVGRTGIVPLAKSLDCAGPMTARASDLWPVLRILVRTDPDDADSVPAPGAWQRMPPTGSVAGLRIGVRKDDDTDCAPEVESAHAHAQDLLRHAGAELVPVFMPNWRAAKLRKAAFLLTECEGAAVYADALSAGNVLPASVQSLLGYGRDVPTGKLVAALAEMRSATAQLERTFSEVDLLITPTTPQRAIRLGDPAPANQADYTALANVAGVPALAIPIEVPDETLPASIQAIGPKWSEARLIDVALALKGQSM